MKMIADIRLYKSEAWNESENPIVSAFGDKKLTANTRRIAMKLKELGFSLGEFDHLYIVFTSCEVAEEMKLSDHVDRYHPWYRECFVKISNDLYEKLGSQETHDDVIGMIANVLVTFFASADFNEQLIRSCIRQVVEQGEHMRMKFKEKVTATRKAEVFLRYLDTCKYYPLLQVFDTEGNLLLEKDLPETMTLDYLGEIQLSAKKVTIKPRKNELAKRRKAMAFDY